jgi:hypothetical protein
MGVIISLSLGSGHLFHEKDRQWVVDKDKIDRGHEKARTRQAR